MANSHNSEYPREYEPIGCKNYPDIRDMVGASVLRKRRYSVYNRKTARIEEIER